MLSRQGHALVFGTAYYTIFLVLNVLLTFFISLRLLIHRRTILAILPAAHARPYVTLTAIVIESAALHTAFALAFVISYGVNSPVNQVMVGFASAAQACLGFAEYPIEYRAVVLTGTVCIASGDIPHNLPRGGWQGMVESDGRNIDGDFGAVCAKAMVENAEHGEVALWARCGTRNIPARARRGIPRP